MIKRKREERFKGYTTKLLREEDGREEIGSEGVLYYCGCGYYTNEKMEFRRHVIYMHEGVQQILSSHFLSPIFKVAIKTQIPYPHYKFKLSEVQYCEVGTYEQFIQELLLVPAHKGESPYYCGKCDKKMLCSQLLLNHILDECHATNHPHSSHRVEELEWFHQLTPEFVSFFLYFDKNPFIVEDRLLIPNRFYTGKLYCSSCKQNSNSLQDHFQKHFGCPKSRESSHFGVKLLKKHVKVFEVEPMPFNTVYFNRNWNINTYTPLFVCGKCSQYFKKVEFYHKHLLTCDYQPSQNREDQSDGQIEVGALSHLNNTHFFYNLSSSQKKTLNKKNVDFVEKRVANNEQQQRQIAVNIEENESGAETQITLKAIHAVQTEIVETTERKQAQINRELNDHNCDEEDEKYERNDNEQFFCGCGMQNFTRRKFLVHIRVAHQNVMKKESSHVNIVMGKNRIARPKKLLIRKEGHPIQFKCPCSPGRTMNRSEAFTHIMNLHMGISPLISPFDYKILNENGKYVSLT